MRKREITPVELKKIIELRHLGSNWTKIENVTNVERRAAKRAFIEWEHDQEVRKQDAVRFRVAAIALNQHFEDIIRIATALVTNLNVSHLLVDLEITSEQFFTSLWNKDLLNQYISPETGDISYSGDWETCRREQELLFDCLKVHTKDYIRWDVLDIDWKNAKNRCSVIVPRLKKETAELVNESSFKENVAKFLKMAEEKGSKIDPLKRVDEIMLKKAWQSIYWDTLGNKEPRFQLEIGGGKALIKSSDLHLVAPTYEVVFTFNVTDKKIAEDLIEIFNAIVDTLLKKETVQGLYREIGNMKKIEKYLREMLNPVKLRPMIYNSRCELCPS